MQLKVPDVLLLDLTMPDLKGIRILEFMQGHHDLANVPVILLSPTNYAEDLLAKQGSRIVVQHSSRISTAKVLRYIRAISDAAQFD